METNKIRLRILTPEAVKTDELADMVILRCVNGDMGVLPGHAPYSVLLGDGALRVVNSGSTRRIAIFGGVAEIRGDVLTVITSLAEWPEDIDRARAESDRERIQRRLRESADDLEIQSDQVKLRRALVQLEVSADALVRETEAGGE